LSDQKHENARAAASGRNNESKYGQWKTSGHKRTKKRSLRVTKDRARKSTVDIRFGQTREERERERERGGGKQKGIAAEYERYVRPGFPILPKTTDFGADIDSRGR